MGWPAGPRARLEPATRTAASHNTTVPGIDLSLDELNLYAARAEPPAGLAEFWRDAVAEARGVPAEPELTPDGPPLRGVRSRRLCFTGLGGARITGWYLRPEGTGPFPGVVRHHGYGGRAARPLEMYTLAAQGFAVLSMDCRGQAGDSEDGASGTGGGQGWLSRGLLDPRTLYYRAVYTDAVRAMDVLASFPEVDAGRLAVTGMSQGGRLTLAAAALSGRASFMWADMPFLCDFPRAVATATEGPYLEVSDLLRRRPDWEERAFRSLAHIDGANLAPLIRCPAVVSVALWDTICPPSTVFGTFRRLANPDRELLVYPYHGHEMPYELEERRLAAFVDRLRAPATDR